jgi:ubiquinone/menaquinone biosynthesis C-methylase UbiE
MFMKILYRLLENPIVYDLNQVVGRPTARVYSRLVIEEVPLSADASLLELGCGTGATRPLIPGRYRGIDINPEYIAAARKKFASDEFTTMDATKLDFPDAAFDQVISIATTHHLDDAQVEAMTLEALRVVKTGGAFHVIDAVLPLDPHERFKDFWFRMDRGRHARAVDELVGVLSRRAAVEQKRVLRISPLHDVAHLKVVRAQAGV